MLKAVSFYCKIDMAFNITKPEIGINNIGDKANTVT